MHPMLEKTKHRVHNIILTYELFLMTSRRIISIASILSIVLIAQLSSTTSFSRIFTFSLSCTATSFAREDGLHSRRSKTFASTYRNVQSKSILSFFKIYLNFKCWYLLNRSVWESKLF